jgi:DNA-binding CsgD family transcriptional regulator
VRLGHSHIGTEHILLGLIREGEGVAAQVLQKLGVSLDRVRQTVIHQMYGYPAGIFGEEVLTTGSIPPNFLRSPSPFEEREKVVLSFLINEGLSTSELANLLGVSEERVGAIVRAVIEKLKHVGE